MKLIVQSIAVVLCVLFSGVTGHAQEEGRWSVYEGFYGSTNTSGQIFRLDTSVGYGLSEHFEIGGGLPLYFVRASSDSANTSTNVHAGLGNAYVDLRYIASGPVSFTSAITGTVPTGDRDKGFSTGRVTVDWNNHVAMPFERVTPFANIGVANTISDTSFFARPFTSLGMVGHFEGGLGFQMTRYLSLGTSGYAIVPGGQQRIVSKLVQRQVQGSTASPDGQGTSRDRGFETISETVGTSDLAKDHGFSTWIDLSRDALVDFQVGYNRSLSYQFNTVFFSVGFKIK
jgi:hypothetical protein